MSAAALARVLQALRAGARRRALAIALAGAVPWLAVAIALAWRLGGPRGAALATGLALLLATGLAWRAATRIDWPELARRLDARAPWLEDSADLLFADAATLAPLPRLQRARVAQQLAQRAPDLRAPWPRALAWTTPLALLLLAVLLLVPAWPRLALPTPPASVGAPAARSPLRLAAVALAVRAPAYTGLSPQQLRTLDASVAAGSTLQWRLRTTGAVGTLALAFHDGRVQALARDGDAWTTTARADALQLYRVLADGRPLDGRWHRITARADRPPRLRVLQPDKALTLVTRAQPDAALLVEASDDYGLGAATLELTLAQGSGENIQVSTRRLALAGSGSATTRQYRRRVDLRALGFAPGDDLVLRVLVADRRAPAPQQARSPAFILRWPAPRGAEASGVEGLVTRTLPAYFRSQRQVIIDTEALLAARRRLAADTLLARSDAIGVDQRLLRLRYGQFLGEASEGAAPAPPRAPENAAPTTTAPAGAAPAIDFSSVVAPPSAPAAPAAPATDAPASPVGPPPVADEHDAGTAAVGDAAALVAAFGHTHDEAEAATLLDPDTRTLLKAALDAMWLAEGQLRTGHPERALPHEYRALRLVKRVQQASRIYLARVGLALPPVDEARRLTGKREGIAGPRDPLAPADRVDAAAPVAALWRALAPPLQPVPAATRTAFDAWLQARLRKGADDDGTLALFEAFADWRVAPGCRDCAARLRARLWPWLPVAPAALPTRAAADARGRRYLDALSEPAP